MNNLSDKKKIFILRAVIAFIILLIILFGVVAILDFLSNDNGPKYLSTTTRRTYTTTSTTSISTAPITNKTENISSSTTTSSSITSTKAKTTKKNNFSTKKPVTSIVTTNQSSSESPIPEIPSYEEATGASNHANAEDSWEWYIVNKINDIREKNGLNRLIVATELRELAETAGDIYYSQGEDAVGDYLDGINNYRFWTINQGVNQDYLVNNTINATRVTTNNYYKYIGVGVIKQINNQNGLPSYHYCIIYQ